MTKKKSKKKKRQFKKILNFYENPPKSNVTCPFRVPCAQETPVRLTGCPHSGMALPWHGPLSYGWMMGTETKRTSCDREREAPEEAMPAQV